MALVHAQMLSLLQERPIAFYADSKVYFGTSGNDRMETGVNVSLIAFDLDFFPGRPDRKRCGAAHTNRNFWRGTLHV
jgi:hypothetical protein